MERYYEDFDIEVDERVLERTRILEGVEFWLFLLLIAAALVGVFGGGGLFERTRSTNGSLTVESPRFARYEAPAQCSVTVKGTGRDSFLLAVDGRLPRDFEVEWIVPDPVATRVARERLVYEFGVEDPAVSARRVVFGVRPKAVGLRTLRFSAEDGSRVSVPMMVYP